MRLVNNSVTLGLCASLLLACCGCDVDLTGAAIHALPGGYSLIKMEDDQYFLEAPGGGRGHYASTLGFNSAMIAAGIETPVRVPSGTWVIVDLRNKKERVIRHADYLKDLPATQLRQEPAREVWRKLPVAKFGWR